MTEEEATRIARAWCEENGGWSTELAGYMHLDTFMVTVRNPGHWVSLVRVYSDSTAEEIRDGLEERKTYE